MSCVYDYNYGLGAWHDKPQNHIFELIIINSNHDEAWQMAWWLRIAFLFILLSFSMLYNLKNHYWDRKSTGFGQNNPVYLNLQIILRYFKVVTKETCRRCTLAAIIMLNIQYCLQTHTVANVSLWNPYEIFFEQVLAGHSSCLTLNRREKSGSRRASIKRESICEYFI